MAATVRTECPSCKTGLRFPKEWAGRTLKCKKCGSLVKTVAAPPPPAPVAAIPVIEPAPVAKAVPLAAPGVPIVNPAPVITNRDSVNFDFAETKTFPPVAAAVKSTKPYTPVRETRSSKSLVIGLLILLIVGGGLTFAGIQFFKPPLQTTESTTPGTKPSTLSGGTLAQSTAPFPRRLLFIHIAKYGYLNPLSAGTGPRGDAAGEVARKWAFDWYIPTDAANNQFFLLSDTAGKTAVPMLKSVLEPSLDQFIATSRKQDRITIYFGGHAIEKEGKAFLAPSDGDLDDPATLIPLETLFAKLASCQAQQKLIVFDVCRFNPQTGRSMPGSEPMTESLYKLLTTAPKGIQSVVTCGPNENAVEYTRSGSEFLSAYRIAQDKPEKPKSTPTPDDPLPVPEWVATVQGKLNQLVVKDGKPGQTLKLTGEPGEAVAFNPEEPLPTRINVPRPPSAADPAAIARIFAMLELPSIRSNKSAGVSNDDITLAIAQNSMKEYLTDAVSLDEAIAAKAKFPIRAAAANAIKTMRRIWRSTGSEMGGLRETFVGEANDRVKKEILAEQETPARIILELEGIIDEMTALESKLDQEPSKRWQATFQYALAQARARIVFMHEYNLMLGVINKNELPPLDTAKGQNGWQMISSEKLKSKKEIRDIADAAQELFAKIAVDHKGTPWAVLAKQHQRIVLGLEWRVVTPGEDKGE